VNPLKGTQVSTVNVVKNTAITANLQDTYVPTNMGAEETYLYDHYIDSRGDGAWISSEKDGVLRVVRIELALRDNEAVGNFGSEYNSLVATYLRLCSALGLVTKASATSARELAKSQLAHMENKKVMKEVGTEVHNLRLLG
jgi:hypothetical protein